MGTSEEIGRCARWDGICLRRQCVHQNHLIRVRCDRSKASGCLYVENYINSPGGRRSLTGTSRTTSGTEHHLRLEGARLRDSTGATARPPKPFRRHRRIRRTTEGQPASPPGRTRHPLRLPAIPRLPGRPLSRYGNLRQLRVPEAGVPACGGERKLCGAPRLRRPAGFLLPCTACAGASGQACLQGREDPEPTEGHEPGRLRQRARLPCGRARGRVAEGGVHPAGGQRGGARQQGRPRRSRR